MAKGICSIEGCDTYGIIVRGWCNKHYLRWLRRGDPHDHGSRIVGDDQARFWSKVEKTDDCWLWTGGLTSEGYGQFRTGGRDGTTHGAHQWSYEQSHGEIPDGLELDHLCRDRACVNPDHLEAVTHAENLRRGKSFAGKNYRKTHCKNGHPFDTANTYWWRGQRHCRACREAAKERYLSCQ